MKHTPAILILSASLWAQDGATVLKQSATVFESYPSYEMTQVTTSEPASMTMTMHIQAKSGKHRMEMDMFGSGFTMLVDGKNSWMIVPAMKRYMRLPTDAASLNDFAGMAALSAMDTEPTDSKILRSESIDVDGASYECWVVEAHGKDGVSTYWIDKGRGFQLKKTLSIDVAGQHMLSTTLTQSIKLNAPLADSVFVFNPPSDFTETDELFPGMGAAMGKLKASSGPAHTAPTHVDPAPGFIAIEPQAFVPMLFPVVQTQPELSGAAKDIHGDVELLVTIDPSGRVVNAEALSGKQVLRSAAIDTVRQWKFNPVIRDGVPVYAATQANVNFMDFSTGPSQDDFDVEEMMAARDRVWQIERKFPRSPQQELADLEQDRGKEEGMRRRSALPELAKAALKADALDKAASYANEALSSPRDGDAVHGGNTVLGLIAMRQGDIEQAKQRLLASGKASGSPVLGSFGPSMLLAKALFEKGERDTVLAYLDSCRAFWKMGAKQLDDWTSAIKAGRAPDFANLL